MQHDAGDATGVLTDHVKGVAMGVPVVYLHGKAVFPRHVHLDSESLHLVVPGRQVPVVVEADLAYPHHSRLAQEALQLLKRSSVRGFAS